MPEAALRTDTALSTPMPSRPTSGSGGSPGDFHGFWQEMGTFSGFFFDSAVLMDFEFLMDLDEQDLFG